VVLSVEVLPDGKPGQILVFSTSGIEYLDEAAQDAVKAWRFTPAKNAEQKPVTQWIKVPITYSLRNLLVY
jgi:protein TonB